MSTKRRAPSFPEKKMRAAEPGVACESACPRNLAPGSEASKVKGVAGSSSPPSEEKKKKRATGPLRYESVCLGNLTPGSAASGVKEAVDKVGKHMASFDMRMAKPHIVSCFWSYRRISFFVPLVPARLLNSP